MSTPTGTALNRIVGYVHDTRYLALVGLTIIVYDAVLTLPNEVYFVWLSPDRKTSTATRLAYSMNRYGTLAMSLLFVSVLFPNGSDSSSWCFGVLTAVMGLYVVTCSCGNGLILHSLIRVWQCSGKVAWMMVIGFVLMHTVTLGFAGLAVKQVKDNISFTKVSFISCVLPQTPSSFLGAFIPAAILDCYAFALLLGNALSRPRNSSQRLLDMLLKDGIIYFLICFGTKAISIGITSAAPTALIFVSWGFGFDLNAAATARLYLRMCETEFLPTDTVADKEDDDRSSYSSFIESISDEGETVSEKAWA